MIRRFVQLLVATALLSLNATAVQAADPATVPDPAAAAALSLIHHMSVSWGDDPASAMDWGFSSAVEADGVTAVATYPVYVLSPEAWAGDVPGSMVVQDTSRSFVVVGIGNDPRLVVTVDSPPANRRGPLMPGSFPQSHLSRRCAPREALGVLST